MNMTTMNKIFSISLSLALALTGTPWPASAAPVAGAPAFADRLAPKASFGYVASSFAPGNEEKPRLVVIADLHAHLDVQRNIMGIMEDLLPKLRGESTKKVPVFLEGGWQAGLEEPLRSMSNTKARRFINDYFLLKAELGGPQAFSEKIAGTKQVTMIGVEDKDEYLANKAVFAKSYPARKQILEAIKMQEASLGLLGNHVEARGYQKLKNMREAYIAGRISPERFAKALLRHASRFNITGKYVETLRNLQSADPVEAEVSFSDVYKEVSTRLSNKRPLMSYVRPSLQNEPTVRKNLAIVNADLDLLKRLIANQLSPAEVTLAFSRIGDLERTAKLLVADQPVTVDVSKVIRESLEFYPLAFLRDETLVKNSLKSLDSFGADATGILVAGGFHTDAIASYLQQRKIAHVVIHPVVSRDMTTDEQINYVKRMCDEHVTPKELEKDIASVRSGKKLARGISAGGASFVGTHQGAVDPKKVDGDLMLGGMSPDVQRAIEQGGAEMVRELEKLGLDVDSQEVDGLTLALRDGKYVVVGQESDASVFADIANAALAASPANAARPETLEIKPMKDVDALKTLGSEAMLSISPDGKTGSLPIAVSRFQSLRAIDEGQKPTAGSKEEANTMRGFHTVGHELGHLARSDQKINEKTTIVRGVGLGAAAAAQRAAGNAQDIANRFANAIQPQLEAGKESQDLAKAGPTTIASKIGNFLTPKALKVKDVQAIAKDLAEEFPEADAAQIQAALNSMEGSLALNAAIYAGNNKMLFAKVGVQIRMLAEYARQA